MLKVMKSLICFIFVFLLLLQKLLFRRGETFIFWFCCFVQSFASVSCPFYLVPVCNFKNNQIVKDIRNFLLKSWFFFPAIIDFLNFAYVFNDFQIKLSKTLGAFNQTVGGRVGGRGPMRPPRGPKRPPIGPQEAPKTPPEAPRRPQETSTRRPSTNHHEYEPRVDLEPSNFPRALSFRVASAGYAKRL